MKRTIMCSVMIAALACRSGAYEIMVVGDTHYLSAATRNEDAKWTKGQQSSYVNTLKRWEGAIPDLLREARERAAQGIDFVVHTGDMIFGECGGGDLHAQAAREGLQMMVTNFPAPFYPVKGNHEVRNAFASAAFEKVLRPYQEAAFKQTNGTGRAANYSMLHKGDLYICFDFLQPDLDFVGRTLAAYPKVRHVFFMSHSPVIPCSFTKAPAAVFDKPHEVEQRRKLIALLASRNAVVVCGHLHRYVFLRYQCAEGTITQVCVFSMSPGAVPRPVKRQDGDGTAFLQNSVVAPALAGDAPHVTALREIFGGMTTFSDFGAATGYVVLRVTDEAVWADFYFHGGKEVVASFQMRP